MARKSWTDEDSDKDAELAERKAVNVLLNFVRRSKKHRERRNERAE